MNIKSLFFETDDTSSTSNDKKVDKLFFPYKYESSQIKKRFDIYQNISIIV